MPEEILIDRLRKACLDPGRRLYGHRLLARQSARAGRKGELAARRTGAVLGSARVFALAPEVTELAAEIASLPPAALAELVPLARPPHGVSWIEWDEVRRIDTLARHGLSRQPDDGERGQVGFLIETLDRGGDTPVYRLTVATELLGEEAADDRHPEAVTVMPIGLLYDPVSARLHDRLTPAERSLNREIAAQEETRQQRAGAAHVMPGLYALGGAWSQRGGAEPGGRAAVEALARTVRYTATGPSRVVIDELDRLIAGGRSDAETKRAEMLNGMLEQGAGDYRFLIAVLAILNARPAAAAERSPVPEGRMRVRGRQLAYLERYTLRLKVPKRRARAAVRRAAGEARPRRAHEVRGTMCHSRDLSSACRHSWQRDPRGVETCRNCGGRRWWRRPHMRGDARVGFVHKDYRVEGARDP